MNDSSQEILKQKILNYTSVEIKDSLDFDIDNCGIGGKIWKGALMMAVFLKSKLIQNYIMIENKTVIEIGAGCGVCGLVTATMNPKKVYLTDRDQGCVELMRRNVELNNQKMSLSDIEVVNLDWINKEDCSKIQDSFDVIIGSDILYSMSMVDSLLKGLDRLCKENGVILLSLHKRGDEYDEFLKRLEISGIWKFEFISEDLIEEKFYNNFLLKMSKKNENI
jgi:predicted nicotinamide N-methyase